MMDTYMRHSDELLCLPGIEPIKDNLASLKQTIDRLVGRKWVRVGLALGGASLVGVLLAGCSTQPPTCDASPPLHQPNAAEAGQYQLDPDEASQLRVGLATCDHITGTSTGGSVNVTSGGERLDCRVEKRVEPNKLQVTCNLPA